jgi:hypothetical protein
VHPRLSFISGASRERSLLEQDLIFTGPIVICGVEDAGKCARYAGSVCFSDCDSVKANSHDGGDPYPLMMHTAGADCLVHGFLNVVYKITFVQYLRRAFAWGGFPGFAEPKMGRVSPPRTGCPARGFAATLTDGEAIFPTDFAQPQKPQSQHFDLYF